MVSTKKVNKSYVFVLLFLIGKIRHGMGTRWLFSIGNGAAIRPLEKGRKCIHTTCIRMTLAEYKGILLQSFNEEWQWKINVPPKRMFPGKQDGR